MLRRGVIIVGLGRESLAQIRLNFALYSHNRTGAKGAPLRQASAKNEEQERPQLHLAA